MDILNRARDHHYALSAVAGRFLELATSHPEYLQPLGDKSGDLPDWVLRHSYDLQAWPTFVGDPKLQEIRRASEEVTRLVKSIPERVFGNDPKKIAAYYGRVSEMLMLLLLEPPNGIEGALARCDFVDSAEGFKCLEVNMGAFVGGWQIRFWEQMFRADPHLSRFLAEQEVSPRFHDPLHAMLRHVARDTRRNVASTGELNVAILVAADFDMAEEAGASCNQAYPAVLKEIDEGLAGEIFVCRDPASLKPVRQQLFHGGRQVCAVLEYMDTGTPEHVYRCFKAGGITLYNGPLGQLLADKRNLALLSRLGDSGSFSPEERKVIQDHIPWTREVARGQTVYREESWDLIDLLLARQEDFVLKPGVGARGEGVHAGRATPRDDWQRLVQAAAAQPQWVAQEFIESRPYLFQSGASGYDLHDVIWGIFCFGRTYGGGFLRMMSRGAGEGIINSARGAKRGFYFEV